MEERAQPSRLRRLFSLSGVVPLGVFLVLHLWTGAALLSSHATYDRQAAALHGGPIVGALEVLLVIVPLAFHALYGAWLAFQPRPPVHTYPSALMLSLERVSGLVVLLFVVAHLRATLVPAWSGHLLVGSYSTRLVEDLSSTEAGVPWTALGYLVGLAATVFHLTAGVTSFGIGWGLVRGAAAERRTRLFARGAGIALFSIGAATVVALATGTRFLGAEEAPAPGPCGSTVNLRANPAPSTLPSAAP
jgi:succinate dehydrogenase / fumarate reductase, cytochrome b subunit